FRRCIKRRRTQEQRSGSAAPIGHLSALRRQLAVVSHRVLIARARTHLNRLHPASFPGTSSSRGVDRQGYHDWRAAFFLTLFCSCPFRPAPMQKQGGTLDPSSTERTACERLIERVT